MTSARKIFQFAMLCAILAFVAGCSNQNKSSLYDLTCENLEDPLGVNTLRPRFSWKITVGEQGTSQSAYQILVAESRDKLTEEDAGKWNSGKVESQASIMVEYDGEPLASGQLLYWKVRIWDDQGNPLPWSEPKKFGIGLMEWNDWSASFIGFPLESGFNGSPQLRKTFTIDKTRRHDNFLLHVNSLGYHEVYVNGKKVNDDVLSPAVTQFDKRSLVVTYDVSPFLKEGSNDLIIWLGSGWYTQGLPGVTGNGPMVRAQLEHLSNGTKEVVLATDNSWTGRESEYSRISDWRSGRYGGETIVGNKETREKVLTSPETVNWKSATITDVPLHKATPEMVEPNRIKETISPSTISRLNDSTWLVDMGKCLTGWFEITFPPLDESQMVVMEYSDHLNHQGLPVGQSQTDRYIASGRGTESFINKFNYHGFRYVMLSNIDQEIPLTDMKAHLIHTDFKITSSFECSDTEMNSIHDMIDYTLRCVGLGGYLVDCPQIERLGYGGDGNASTVTAQTMFNLAPLYNNWLQAWKDVIREDGSMPHTAPNPYSAGGGPYWCGFIISATWNTYQQYGDVQLLEKYYPIMLQWLGYVEAHSVDGLLKQWPNTNYRNWYLGDWATPEGVGNPNHINKKSIDLVSNCYISVCFDQMQKIASAIGKNDDAAYFAEKRIQLNTLIHDTFFDSQTGMYGTGSQIDFIFPMLAGATPAELLDTVTENLITQTDTAYNGHLNTGLVGIPVMMEWAALANQPDFIYSMLKKKTYPGYLFMLEQGATTTWEHWNGERSRIHNCYNGVGQWFYQSIGGIRPIQGEVAFSKFVVDPQIPEGVTWAKTMQETPFGTINVDWELLNDKMSMEVNVPVGSVARIIPRKGTTAINLNGEQMEGQNDPFELKSGKYLITFSL